MNHDCAISMTDDRWRIETEHTEILSVRSLFNDAFSVTQTTYIASNGSKRRIGKDVKGNGGSLILKYYSTICLQGLRKTTKNISHVSRSPGQNVNLGTLD
jgi:hypothetical protein